MTLSVCPDVHSVFIVFVINATFQHIYDFDFDHCGKKCPYFWCKLTFFLKKKTVPECTGAQTPARVQCQFGRVLLIYL